MFTATIPAVVGTGLRIATSSALKVALIVAVSFDGLQGFFFLDRSGSHRQNDMILPETPIARLTS